MATVTFEEIEAEVLETTETPSKEVAVRQDTQLAIAGEDPSKGIYGEWGREDVRLPRINLVNKVGDLSNSFTPGTWVINKEHQINKIDPKDKKVSIPMRVIPVRLLAEYKESLEYNPDVRPRVFKTAEEVRAHGGVIAFGRGEGKFAKVGHIEFFVEAPDDLEDDASADFFYAFGEKKYARVIYTASGSAYAETASILYNDVRSGFLSKTGLGGGFYLLGSKTKTNDYGTFWIPSLKTAGAITGDLFEEVKATIG